MPVFAPFPGMPGYGSEKIAKHRPVAADGYLQMLPGGVILDGAKARDPDNPDYNASTDAFAQYRLRAGLLVGKVTANDKWANSVIGRNTGALANGDTTLTLASAQQAVELVRRVGATGTFKVTGPPTAAGTVRTLTATYSAVNTTTGAVTITALGANEVQTVNLATAATAGTLRLLVQKTDGTYALTPAVTYSATDATLLSNLQTALDTATGVVNGIVATAIAATDTDLGFVLTYSGTGYARNTWALAEVHTLFTGNTGANVVRTTTGVDGRFVTLSLVQPTDGSETIRSFVPDGWEVNVPLDGTDAPLDKVPLEGNVDFSQLLPWPADASLKQWVRDSLNTYGKFVDTSKY
jgi:hypothetical protein